MKINYDEIMALGFTEEIVEDQSYYAEHGYEYTIINKDLTKRIYLDWEKENKLCYLVRLKKNSEGDIAKKKQVNGLKELKQIIDFFED